MLPANPNLDPQESPPTGKGTPIIARKGRCRGRKQELEGGREGENN